MMMKRAYCAIVLSSLFAVLSASGQNTPKVVVGIVVDQLRSDYVERFDYLYGDGGFRRLRKEGLVYTNAGFDYSTPDRASAVATIFSGTEPCYHGITGNRYLDRKSLKVLSCVDDDHVKGVHTAEKTSPSRLLVTTLADELKVATGGKSSVMSVAAERDVAVLAAGHAADVVLWLNDANAMWASSTCYGDMPSWMSVYNHRATSAFDFKSMKWTPLYSMSVYQDFSDDEMPKAFVHTFSEKSVKRYKTSAIMNDEVTQIAKTCLTSGTFGRGRATDMLCVGLYAGNYEHQSEQYSPLELQDIYSRLDRNIADLLEAVDERVGLDNAVIFLTSTGYADVHQPTLTEFNLPTGEVRMERCTMLLNMYLGAIYGSDAYVEASYRNQIYLNHKLLEDKQLKLKEVLEHCSAFLGQMSGVRRAYTCIELTNGTVDAPVCRAYHNERQGDVQIEIAPGWSLVDDRWNETVWSSRAQVPTPVMFLGAGISPNVSTEPIMVEAIAPTVASLLKITAPNGCAVRSLSF